MIEGISLLTLLNNIMSYFFLLNKQKKKTYNKNKKELIFMSLCNLYLLCRHFHNSVL